MMDDTSSDRRSFPRVKLSTRVDVMLDGHASFDSGVTANLGEGGVFIEIEAPWPRGTSFSFGMRPRAGVALVRGSAEVVWVRSETDGPGRPAGMGARFVDVDEEGLDILRSLVVFETDEGDPGTPDVFTADEMDLEATVPDAPGPRAEDADAGFVVTREIETVSRLRDDRHVLHGRTLGRRLAATAALLAVGVSAALLFVAWYGDAETDLLGRLLSWADGANEVREDDGAVETAAESLSAPRVARQAMRVEEVSTSSSIDESVVVIHGSGAFSPQQVSSERLEDPPRYVVQLFGMTAPFPKPTVEATGPGLTGIRVGQHADGSRLETRVVLDLSSSEARVERPAVLGNTVVVRITN